MNNPIDKHAWGANEYPLSASVTTAVAYRTAFANHICNCLAEATGIPPETQTLVLTAVMEAVSNGAIHGNLELGSNSCNDDLETTLASFKAYCQTIEERLDNQCLASRRVDLTARWDDDLIEVSVRNQGRGYDTKTTTKGASPLGISGRGLEIIKAVARSVEFGQGGRRITMTFSR